MATHPSLAYAVCAAVQTYAEPGIRWARLGSNQRPLAWEAVGRVRFLPRLSERRRGIATDVLSKTADEIRVRLTELEPLVAEQQRLKTALGALESLIDQDGHRPEPSPEVEWIGLVAVSLSLLTLTGGAEEKPTPATPSRT
jgi:hypothetical protein